MVSHPDDALERILTAARSLALCSGCRARAAIVRTQPGEECGPRESPFVADGPARDISAFGYCLQRRVLDTEHRRGLLQREHLESVLAQSGAADDQIIFVAEMMSDRVLDEPALALTGHAGKVVEALGVVR